MILYRLLVSLAAPLVALRLLWRRLSGAETARDLAERLGRPAPPPGEGPLLWLHGASNGELASARAFAGAALAAIPGLRLLVTANTATGRALAESWGLPGSAAQLAPLDHQAVLARFLACRPAALVTVESEVWPNRFAACAGRGVPVLVIGARLSERSARRWRLAGPVLRPALRAVAFLSAQDEGSAARFRALGLAGGRLGPTVNLKTAAAPAPPDPEAVAALGFRRARTLLAASTHEGEEEAVLAAFAAAREALPDLRLILAPRHPRRGPAVAALIARAGLGFATRSAGEAPDPARPVYLADTMGEMALWYAAAGLCFVGGSLADRGGHTPYEPAAFGAAILHGPHVANFAAAYAALAAAGGALACRDAASLAAAIREAADPARQQALAEAARGALAASGPEALAPLLAALGRALAAAP